MSVHLVYGICFVTGWTKNNKIKPRRNLLEKLSRSAGEIKLSGVYFSAEECRNRTAAAKWCKKPLLDNILNRFFRVQVSNHEKRSITKFICKYLRKWRGSDFFYIGRVCSRVEKCEMWSRDQTAEGQGQDQQTVTVSCHQRNIIGLRLGLGLDRCWWYE